MHNGCRRWTFFHRQETRLRRRTGPAGFLGQRPPLQRNLSECEFDSMKSLNDINVSFKINKHKLTRVSPYFNYVQSDHQPTCSNAQLKWYLRLSSSLAISYDYSEEVNGSEDAHDDSWSKEKCIYDRLDLELSLHPLIVLLVLAFRNKVQLVILCVISTQIVRGQRHCY